MGKKTLLGGAAIVVAAAVSSGALERDARADDLRTLALEPSAEQPQPPNAMLITTGAVIFAVPYGFSVASAATSHVSSDKWLYVPVAGPWGDIIARLACTSSNCKGDLAVAALPLVLSGLGQAAGVGVIIKALIDPPNGWAQPQKAADNRPHIQVTPVSYAGGGGLAAFGKF
jgi:hypothetical protein